MNFANSSMDKRSSLLYPLMLIAAVVVIAFSVAGIATTMGWMPGVRLGNEPAAGPDGARPQAAAGPVTVCAKCGVVESVRAVEIQDNRGRPTSFEIRVRMDDGTYRTFHEESRPALRAGQKVRATERGVAAAG